MEKKFIKTILFILIVIGLPILANVIVEILASIVTIEMIINVVYLALGLSIFYILKEVK